MFEKDNVSVNHWSPSKKIQIKMVPLGRTGFSQAHIVHTGSSATWDPKAGGTIEVRS